MFYEENMKAIETCKQYLFSRIKSNDTTISEIDIINLIPAKDGGTALELTHKGKNYRLNSLYSPLQEAKRWTNQFTFRNIGTVFIMFGLGNGFFARELMKRLGNDGILFIYEPCKEIFFHVLRNCDISDIISSSNVALSVEDINDNEIKNLLSNHINWFNLKSQVISIHPQYDMIFTDSLKRFYKMLQDNNNRAIVNNNTDVVISKKIIDNTLINMKHLKSCNLVTDLIGKIDVEIPAIIVAAGPSLDKNIHKLKLAKGKAVIFAVDTAVKYLLAQEILPDFIVTLDPSKALHHLKDERCNNIPLFSRIDSRPENIENNQKKIILYNIEGYVNTILETLGKNTGELKAGGSVATGAFSICETIGFKRIILVGQDLAYSGESTHAGGVNIDVGGAGKFTEIVEDIYGNPIKTRYDWYVYIKWFEDAVDLFEGDEVIDATEGGAKINGTTILTLKEAIDKYCKKDIKINDVIDKLEPTVKSGEIKNIKVLLLESVQELDEIKEVLDVASKLCDNLINKYEKALTETNSSIIKNKKLSDLNAIVESKKIYEIIDWDISAATSEHMSDIYTYIEDEKQNKLRTYYKAKAIYTAIDESVTRLKPLLENTLLNFI